MDIKTWNKSGADLDLLLQSRFVLTPGQKYGVVVIGLLLYVICVIFNLTLLLVILVEKKLHRPMYFILLNQPLIDLLGSGTMIPKVLSDILTETDTVRYPLCFLQGFLLHLYGSGTLLILAAMAIDRYIAICNPLRYNSIMSAGTVIGTVFAICLPLNDLIGITAMLPRVLSDIVTQQHSVYYPTCVLQAFLLHIQLHKPMHILLFNLPINDMLGASAFFPQLISSIVAQNRSFMSHSYCDNPSLLSLVCTDTTINNIYGLFITASMQVFAVGMILYTYLQILVACIYPAFIFGTIAYCFILFCNTMVLITIALHSQLHKPMHILLFNLPINDMLGASAFFPQLISSIVAQNRCSRAFLTDCSTHIQQNFKFFVFCHGFIQLAQLLVSGYLKSSISTIERRYGFTSQKSGLLACFNEVKPHFLKSSILFAVTVIGPAVAFMLGSVMLNFYVDIDKIPYDEIELQRDDPRWVGAWWLGFLLAAIFLALTSLPYFFFPKEMPKEESPERSIEPEPEKLREETNKSGPLEHRSLTEFLRTLMSTIAVFLCVILTLPLFFLGCPTQNTAGVFPIRHENNDYLECSQRCSCQEEDFNPVCGSNGVEYKSPCYAGCNTIIRDSSGVRILNYTDCSCISTNGFPSFATPGSCGSGCSRLLLPFMIFCALTGFVASFSHTPSFMMILRTVKPEDKSFALGIQFMLFRVLAFLPGPVLYGSTIDKTCILWGRKCSENTSCLYYNLDLFRQRFLGLQLLFKFGAFLCFLTVLLVLRKNKQNQRARQLDQNDEAETMLKKLNTAKQAQEILQKSSEDECTTSSNA
ncbi:hypothetical protein JZ751_002220 [Albula glossodonta]|uniref:Solute carrier organic anion transporter family member n=1 Tax=Albula glossodonta TaxID=121402 RepID=A0A8T2P7F9_9TELE|nr:hypothetical protein JZ751_002220 [Albula glossodonta]